LLSKTIFGLNLAYTSLIIFVLAWIGQFWGHNVEGKKAFISERPSIFDDWASMGDDIYL
jgi:uncharacterized membrane protein YGL010W